MKTIIKTRMHSSKMRTVCNSGRILGGCLLAGGCLLRGVSAPGGVCLGGVYSGECVCSRGVSALGGSAPGGVCSGGVCSWGGVCSQGVYPSMHWGRHPPCGQTDACKNITFANSLRTVISYIIVLYWNDGPHNSNIWTNQYFYCLKITYQRFNPIV